MSAPATSIDVTPIEMQAINGDTAAQYQLGLLYQEGTEVNKNHSLASYWFLKAAMAKHTEAAFSLAKLHADNALKQLDYKRWLLAAAEQDHQQAASTVAKHYSRGEKLFTLDYPQAYRWHKTAAELGSLKDRYYSILFLLLGIGTEADPNAAFEQLQALAQQWDHSWPHLLLAACCRFGEGTTQDYYRAMVHVNMSMRKKTAPVFPKEHSSAYLGYFFADILLTYPHHNAKRGFELLENAAKDGLAIAQYQLAHHYRKGHEHWPQDNNKAQHWLTQAANQCYKPAQLELTEWKKLQSPAEPTPVQTVVKPPSPARVAVNAARTVTHVPKKLIKQEEAQDAIAALHKLVGLSNVKARVRALVNEIRLRKERTRRGLPVRKDRSYHMIFTGNPGTGKTVVARILARVFYELGIIKADKIIETDRSGLVAEFIGQTAKKTNEMIDSARGGVLFIDEAYALNVEGRDFGKEAIETLLKKMEDERENLIVIAAGYTAQMKSFLDSNVGLASRFTHTIHFDDYTEAELLEIFNLIAVDNGYLVQEQSHDVIKQRLSSIKAEKAENFGNAREVRNLFEHAIQEQENRICSGDLDVTLLSDEQLQTLQSEDFDLC